MQSTAGLERSPSLAKPSALKAEEPTAARIAEVQGQGRAGPVFGMLSAKSRVSSTNVRLALQQDRIDAWQPRLNGGVGRRCLNCPPSSFSSAAMALASASALWKNFDLRPFSHPILRQCASLGRTSRSRLNLPLQGHTERHNY